MTIIHKVMDEFTGATTRSLSLVFQENENAEWQNSAADNTYKSIIWTKIVALFHLWLGSKGVYVVGSKDTSKVRLLQFIQTLFRPMCK